MAIRFFFFVSAQTDDGMASAPAAASKNVRLLSMGFSVGVGLVTRVRRGSLFYAMVVAVAPWLAGVVTPIAGNCCWLDDIL